jgi:cytochrome c553
MNCDHAFDLMTDPALDDCARLHAHLDACPRCRQMYETLSPALGLFGSSGNGFETARAEEAAAAGGVEIAERVAVRLAREPQLKSAAPRARRPLQAWACVLAGGLVLFSAVGLSVPHSGAPAAPAAAGQCTWLHREAVSPDQRAEALVLSCVACHAAPQQHQEQEPTTALPSVWTEWSVPTLVEIEPVLPLDDPAWLQRAVWPSEPTAHS